MKALNQQGFIDEIDADQFNLTISNIKNTASMIGRQYESFKRLLNFQMGLDLYQPIELTDNLDSLIEIVQWNSILADSFLIENTIDYKLVDASEKIAKQNLKLQKVAFLPDVAAVYMHHEEFNKEAFSFTPADMVAVSVNIPIFSSGSRYAKYSQAKINYEKAKDTKWQASQGISMQFEDTKASLLNAIDKYNTQKQNLTLSNKILNRAYVKYAQGTISSMELSQIQNQFFTAQSDYFTSIVQLINSYNKLNRMLKKYNY